MTDQTGKNFEIKDEKIEALLRGIASKIKSVMPEGWNFSIFFISSDNTLYISSMEREAFLISLIEFIERNIADKASTRSAEDSGGKSEPSKG